MSGDTIAYRVAKKEDFGALKSFLLEFYIPNEPTCSSLALAGSKEASDFINPVVEECLADPVSFVALNENEEIIGALVCSLRDLTKESEKANLDKQHACDTKVSSAASPLEIWLAYRRAIDAEYGTLVPRDCREMLVKFAAVCVNTVNYGRRGIARKLVEMTLENADVKGCKGAVETCTAKASQGLFKKTGFEILKVVKHDEFVDEAGKRLIHCNDGTDQGQLLFKRL
eukprot:Seg1683.9 transcript_id=Seg1683.9/GoldUCD/mRNA.D3Y31 product="hypothetical protein" protein_id=Seg1683.9/GoldUCD/D3Y31